MSKRNTPAKNPKPKKARTSPSQTKATQVALDFEFDDDSMVIPGAIKPAKHVENHTDFNAQLRECHLGYFVHISTP